MFCNHIICIITDTFARSQRGKRGNQKKHYILLQHIFCTQKLSQIRGKYPS